jgi:hypothetical protein
MALAKLEKYRLNEIHVRMDIGAHGRFRVGFR